MKKIVLSIVLFNIFLCYSQQDYTGRLTHTHGYFTINPFDSTYEDGSEAQLYYDGLKKKIAIFNSDASTHFTNFEIGNLYVRNQVYAYGKGRFGSGVNNSVGLTVLDWTRDNNWGGLSDNWSGYIGFNAFRDNDDNKDVFKGINRYTNKAVIEGSNFGFRFLYRNRVNDDSVTSHKLNELMTINNNGNVGIGTSFSSLSSKLQVQGDEKSTLRLYRNGVNDKYLSLWHGTSGGVLEAVRPEGELAYLYLGYTNPTDIYMSKSGGKVRIGYSATYSSLNSALNVSSAYDEVMTYQTTDDSWLYTAWKNKSGERIAYTGLDRNLQNFIFGVEKTANRFSFMGGGVGINTLNPQPGYQLAVNGNIKAKEIKVETNWADFVFEDTYKLPTLKEVEQQIEEKGHLKDIPSAKEVEENGINLGEMNSKLLQKIEELTLYVIQQQKEIELLKQENKGLKKLSNRLDKLEKLMD